MTKYKKIGYKYDYYKIQFGFEINKTNYIIHWSLNNNSTKLIETLSNTKLQYHILLNSNKMIKFVGTYNDR